MPGCFHCGGEGTVVWDSDFSFEDFYGEGETDGIVHVLHCSNCCAIITYSIPLNQNEEEEE